MSSTFPTLVCCTACGMLRFYPKPLCPSCHAPGTEKAGVVGEGTLYTFSVVYRAPTKELKDETPYIIALVDLDEGARVTGRLEMPESGEPVCGARVRLKESDRPYALFEIAGSEDW